MFIDLVGNESIQSRHYEVVTLQNMLMFYNALMCLVVANWGIGDRLASLSPYLPISLSPYLPISLSPYLPISLSPKKVYTDLPVIHLDAYYWQSGWQENDPQQWLQIQQELIQCDRWIIDGNYGNTMDIRLAVADTVIWLDFNRYLCLWRVCKRYLKYPGKTRPDMAANCPERLTREFLQYVWNFPSTSL
jgi:hypothetical protein